MSSSLKVTPLPPPTKLNTFSARGVGTHSPKTDEVNTLRHRLLLAEELSLNAS